MPHFDLILHLKLRKHRIPLMKCHSGLGIGLQMKVIDLSCQRVVLLLLTARRSAFNTLGLLPL